MRQACSVGILAIHSFIASHPSTPSSVGHELNFSYIYSILNNVGPTVYEDHMKTKFARLGHSMWVCWWTKRVWVGFSQGFSLYPLPQISIIISPHSSHPFRFIWSAPLMVRQAWSAGILAHSPTLPSLHLRHISFYNPSVASPTSQALHLCHIAHSPTHPSLHLRHISFYNYSVASSTSQALHLRHLARRPWFFICS